MKGKPTPKLKQMNLTEVDDSESDESLSSLSDGSQGHSEKSNGSDNEDNHNFDVVRMTDREVRQMFNDEVSFFILVSPFDLKYIVLGAPGCRSWCSFVVWWW